MMKELSEEKKDVVRAFLTVLPDLIGWSLIATIVTVFIVVACKSN